MTSDVQNGCGPLCVNFTGNSSASCTSSSWDFGDGGTSTQASPAYCYQLPGTYNVIYTCTDANGCAGTDTISSMITVFANPSASFNIIPSGTIQLSQSGTQVCMSDQSTNASAWAWTVYTPSGTLTSNQQNPCFTIADTGSYYVTLTVQSPQGCSDLDSMFFNAENPCGDIYVPTAFSPNGDNQNDTLFVYGGCISFMQFEVYSRWGEQVFISTTTATGWDGTWRGKPCEAGVFTYVLRGQLTDGSPIEKQGNITLVR